MLFEKTDLFFAKTFSDDEEVRHFLAYLFKRSREGHLCAVIDNTLDETIINGSKKISLQEAFIKVDNRWYLRRNYECEKQLLLHLNRMKEAPRIIIAPEIDETLTKEQQNCVKAALNNSLTFVTGGPGTGKTKTAVAIISHFQDKKVAVCAPTGKATAHLRSLLAPNKNHLVTTLQALLKKNNYLDFDLILVDEGSMIDAFLMTHLFSSILPKTKLVLLGDVNQLPPVGVGNFFSDLVNREKDCLCSLTKCLRAELKEVIDLADQIMNEEIFPIPALPKQRDLIEELSKKLTGATDLKELFSFYKKFRLMTALRKGPFGVDTLNQRIFDKSSARFIPIMITVNDQELYNGDFGFIDRSEKMAYFENGKTLPLYSLPSYEYSYILSVHKSQGSEFDEIELLLPEGSMIFGKEMLYTAVTRAKRKAHIFGDANILEKIYQVKGKKLSGLQP